MSQTSVTALLLAGMIAFARPALAGSDNPQSFSGLQDVRAERLTEREMASITGQGALLSSSVVTAINNFGKALQAAARKQ